MRARRFHAAACLAALGVLGRRRRAAATGRPASATARAATAGARAVVRVTDRRSPSG